jgi:MtN3 and saliva related transmembrane protein
MDAVDLVGWGASAVLLATLGRQVWVQWRERSTAGVSSWLFVGQIAASIGFIVYSWLLDNPVFIFTNTMIVLTAITGQLIYRHNVRRHGADGKRDGRNGDQVPPGRDR